MGTYASLVAHQGGWDEAVFVAVPMVVLAGLLWAARRRAEREQAEEAERGAVVSDDVRPPEPPGQAGG